MWKTNFNEAVEYIIKTVREKTGVSLDDSVVVEDRSYDVYFFGARTLAQYATRFEKSARADQIRNVLELYGVMMKAVDMVTDDGTKTMNYYCDLMKRPSLFDRDDFASSLVSSFVKIGYVGKEDLDNFYAVARESLNERNSRNVNEYLCARREVTRYLVKIGIISIREFIDNKRFNEFFYRLLHVVDLFDCACDLREDVERKEISFHVGLQERLKIYSEATKYFVTLVVRYPFVLKDVVRFWEVLNRPHR
ncbi:MAG: hypothetical protein V1885_01895 [Candidatus Brennerbacteria bacterium]